MPWLILTRLPGGLRALMSTTFLTGPSTLPGFLHALLRSIRYHAVLALMRRRLICMFPHRYVTPLAGFPRPRLDDQQPEPHLTLLSPPPSTQG